MTLMIPIGAGPVPAMMFLPKAKIVVSGGCKTRGVAEIIPRGQVPEWHIKCHAIVSRLVHEVLIINLTTHLMQM